MKPRPDHHADEVRRRGQHARDGRPRRPHPHRAGSRCTGRTRKAAKQVNAVLKPKQWIKLIDRLEEIDNPTVRLQALQARAEGHRARLRGAPRRVEGSGREPPLLLRAVGVRRAARARGGPLRHPPLRGGRPAPRRRDRRARGAARGGGWARRRPRAAAPGAGPEAVDVTRATVIATDPLPRGRRARRGWRGPCASATRPSARRSRCSTARSTATGWRRPTRTWRGRARRRRWRRGSATARASRSPTATGRRRASCRRRAPKRSLLPAPAAAAGRAAVRARRRAGLRGARAARAAGPRPGPRPRGGAAALAGARRRARRARGLARRRRRSPRRLDELPRHREAGGAAAAAALQGGLQPEQTEAVEAALQRLEATLRASSGGAVSGALGGGRRATSSALLPGEPALDEPCARERGGRACRRPTSRRPGPPARAAGAAAGRRRILEVGTLGGYSTLVARALPRTAGRHARGRPAPRRGRAREPRPRRRGGAVEIVVGPALETLPGVEGPFDLVFIDADKQRSADYLALALEKARPGALIVVDNVVRGGALADPADDDPRVRLAPGGRGDRGRAAAPARVRPRRARRVGAKGWDGDAARAGASKPRSRRRARARPPRRRSSRRPSARARSRAGPSSTSASRSATAPHGCRRGGGAARSAGRTGPRGRRGRAGEAEVGEQLERGVDRRERDARHACRGPAPAPPRRSSGGRGRAARCGPRAAAA